MIHINGLKQGQNLRSHLLHGRVSFCQSFIFPSYFNKDQVINTNIEPFVAVGHVIGLGDRHSENILVDTSSGDCVHVDFDW